MDFITSTRHQGLTSAHITDAEFFDPQGRLSIDCDRPSAHHLITHYSYQVSRSPRSLVDHVRLILLLRLHGTAADLNRALHRLSDVLGNAGAGLRQSLLAQCRQALDDEHFSALQQRLLDEAGSSTEGPHFIGKSV